MQASIAHLTSNIGDTVNTVLNMANLKPEQVDTVFFTGGSSGVRGLRQQIASIVPNATKVEGDLFGSIGSGLGLDAARRFA